MNFLPVVVVLISALFFPLGYLISKLFKNKKNILDYLLGIAFLVMAALVFLEMIPEYYEEAIESNKAVLFLGYILLGIIINIALDKFIPHHSHKHGLDENLEEHNKHGDHIGIISTISLAIHNIVEGILIYTVTTTDLKHGLILAFSVALHNIPLAIQIPSIIENKNKKLITVLTLFLSMLVGVFVIIFIDLNSTYLILLEGIAIGMLIYLVIFELLREIIRNSNKKRAIIGMLIGIIIVIISTLIHSH